MDDTVKTKIGIVIVSYNASTAVMVTLASLRQAVNVTPYELLLVDNNSSDDERARIGSALKRHVSEAQLPWSYLQLDENLGFAGGNNVGIEKFIGDNSISH